MAVKKVALASTWMSVTDIIERLSRARKIREQQIELLNSLERRVKQRRDDVERSLADLPPPQRSQVITRAANGHRSELKRQTVDARLALVREICKVREEIASARAHYQSAVQMLMREGLGSERRSHLLQQITTSGPAELASLAALAASAADKELGAALCSRIVGLTKSDRSFSPQELADALVGEEYRRVIQALMEVDRIALEVVAADTAFEVGKSNPARNLQASFMRRDEQSVGADLSDLDAFLVDKEA